MITIPPTNRRHAVTWLILTAVYAGTAWQGLDGGLHDMGVAEDPGEGITAGGELLFGLGAAVATVARLAGVVLSGRRRLAQVRRISWWGAWAWAAGSVIAGGTAPATFGEVGPGPALAAAAAVAVVVGLVLALDRWSWRDDPEPPTPDVAAK